MKRTLWIVPVVALSAALVWGFGRPAAAEGPAADVSRLSPEQKFKRFFAEAKTRLRLTAPQQKKVLALAASLKAEAKPLHALRAEAMTELARQIKAGKVDKAVFQLYGRKFAAQAEVLKPKVAASLNQLHGLLDARQRQELVRMIEEKHQARAGFRHHRRHHAAHRKAMGKKLDLTIAQRARLMSLAHDARSEHKAMFQTKRDAFKKRIEAAKTAFLSENFDATTLHAEMKKSFNINEISGKIAGYVQKALPVLEADQRAKLATILEQKAKKAEVRQ